MTIDSLRSNALLYLACAWLLGSVAAATGGPELLWPVVAALACAGVLASLLRLELRYALFGVLTVVLVIAGGHWYDQHTPSDNPSGLAVHNGAAAVRFRALVMEEPEVVGRSQRVRLAVREEFADGRWSVSSGGVLLRAGQFPRYGYGDVLDVTGKVETPPTFPDFDYRQYLSLHGIQAVVAYADVQIIGVGQGNPAKAALLRVRGELARGLERVLPEPQAALAAGIFAGQRSSIPDDLTADMNATGTSHLVAVSGQNIAIIAALTISGLAWLIGRRQAAILALLAIAGYVLLTGASPSVVRAGIMGGLFVTATLVGRPASAAASIALAGAIMVGFNPLVVHDVSFQLSFAAVLGLIYLAPAIEFRGAYAVQRAGLNPQESRIASFLIESFSITLAAIVATLPLTALHFDRISVVAPIANLPLVPAFPLILASSGITAVASLVWEPLGEVAAWASWAVLTYMIETVRFFAALPAASVGIGGFGPWHAAGAYCALAIVAVWLARRPTARSQEEVSLGGPDHGPSPELLLRRGPFVRPLWLLAGALAMGCALVWTAAFSGSDDRLTVSFLDVGQGDAILIETPDGRHVLIDGGASGLVLAQRLGEELPFWQRRIDLVALTHPDEDHVGGLVDTLERYDVEQVIAPPFEQEGPTFQEWRNRIDDRQIAYEELTAGGAIDLGSGASLNVFAPNPELLSADKSNNASLVMKLTWGDVSFLLTGDIEVGAEEALMASGVDLRSTVLKVAHHGSTTSSSAAFLEAVQPSVAVISVGTNNPYGHPAPSVLDRLDAESIVLRTDQHGTIELTTDGSRIWVNN